MYGSLFEGDYVVINKLAYGARLPFTPLSLSITGEKKYVDWIQLPYFRMFGYSAIERNDVIAFNYELAEESPVDMQEEFIKRCVALPGDMLQIKAGEVLANGAAVKNANVYNVYRVSSNDLLDTALLKRRGIVTDKAIPGEKTYVLIMSAAAADSLLRVGAVQSVSKDAFAPGDYNPAVYPHFAEFPWNYDHFGPLYIPKKGDSILLTKTAITLYQRCIEVYEKQSISYKGDSIYISGKPCRYYHFAMNYYFVLGDNRHNSIDSRVMGLIPEDHIIGRASLVLYSTVSSSRRFLKIR